MKFRFVLGTLKKQDAKGNVIGHYCMPCDLALQKLPEIAYDKKPVLLFLEPLASKLYSFF